MRTLSVAVLAVLLLLPAQSQAHIKGFCAYDTTVPPLPITQVLSPTFMAVAVLFGSVIFVAFIIDRMVNTKDWARQLDERIFRSEATTSTIIRVSVGVLFIVLWS